jgi:hypothetical protein
VKNFHIVEFNWRERFGRNFLQFLELSRHSVSM